MYGFFGGGGGGGGLQNQSLVKGRGTHILCIGNGRHINILALYSIPVLNYSNVHVKV